MHVLLFIYLFIYIFCRLLKCEKVKYRPLVKHKQLS